MTILDLGSGFGEFCRFARERGAASVTGVEISTRMLAEAKNQTGDSGITYIKAAIEDYPIDGNAFDLIVSRLTLHYIKDYRGVVLAAFRGLREGGSFVFSVEHPICTALLKGWQEDERRKKRLEEAPKGFKLEGVGYTCFICGNGTRAGEACIIAQ